MFEAAMPSTKQEGGDHYMKEKNGKKNMNNQGIPKEYAFAVLVTIITLVLYYS